MQGPATGDLALHNINLGLVGAQLVRAETALIDSEAELAALEAELLELAGEPITPESNAKSDAMSAQKRELLRRSQVLRSQVARLHAHYQGLLAASDSQRSLAASDRWNNEFHPSIKLAWAHNPLSVCKQAWQRHADSCSSYLRRNGLPADMAARKLMLKRAAWLLVLTLAYLQYYFLDVQSQIARLPATVINIT